MFWWPVTSYLALAFWGLVIVMLGIQEDTMISLIVAPFWFGLLVASYYMMGYGKSELEGMDKIE